MPRISVFFGIIIELNFNDHHLAHFHASYGGFKAVISINNLTIKLGLLPPRALGLVIE